ncbi:SAM-dependent methyltransferase [Amycolatopsis lurida]
MTPTSTSGEPAAVPRGAAEIFNSTVASFAIATAWEVGAFEVLHDSGTLDVPEFCGKQDLHQASIRGMFSALASVGVVVRAEDKVRPGPEFAGVYRNKAFFHWLTIGCAELFAKMPSVVRNEFRVGAFYQRDAAAIGFACREINQQAFDPVFWQAVAGFDFTFATVADLGCGSGGRLEQLARRYPGIRGLGLDISAEALAAAAAYLNVSGFGDRFELVRSDVRAIRPDPRFEAVEVLTCFMMGHDFWPREECVDSLRRLREAFPNVRRFLLGDTARTDGVADREKQVFTVGFETAHDLMGVYLPTLAEWEGVVEESGWRCLRVRRVDVPADSFIYELA